MTLALDSSSFVRHRRDGDRVVLVELKPSKQVFVDPPRDDLTAAERRWVDRVAMPALWKERREQAARAPSE